MTAHPVVVEDVEGVKLVNNEEKCGLDMSMCDELPPRSPYIPAIGGGKGDHVFVNGCNAVSDDSNERHGNTVSNGSNLNDHSCERDNTGGFDKFEEQGFRGGDRNKLGSSESYNDDNSNNGSKVEGGELTFKNRDTNESESEGEIEVGKLVNENGGSNVGESELKVEASDSKVETRDSLKLGSEVTSEGGKVAVGSEASSNSGWRIKYSKLKWADLAEIDDSEDDDGEFSFGFLDNDKVIGTVSKQNGTVDKEAGHREIDVEAKKQQEHAYDLEPQKVEVEAETSQSPKVLAEEQRVSEDNNLIQSFVEVEVGEMVEEVKEPQPCEADISHQSPKDEIRTVDEEDRNQEVDVEAKKQQDHAYYLEPQNVEVEAETSEPPEVLVEEQASEDNHVLQSLVVVEVEVRETVEQVKELQPCEDDVSHQSPEGEIMELQSSDAEINHPEHSVKPRLLEGESREIPPLNNETKPQLDLQSPAEEMKELGSIEGEAKVKEQHNLVSASECGDKQELSPMDLEASRCELQALDDGKGEMKDQNNVEMTAKSQENQGLQTASVEYETEKQSFPDSTGQSVDKPDPQHTNMQSINYAEQDEPELTDNECRNDNADKEIKSLLSTEVAENQESQMGITRDVHQEMVKEELPSGDLESETDPQSAVDKSQARSSESSLTCPPHDAHLETAAPNEHVNVANKSSSLVHGVGLKVDICFGSFDAEDYEAIFSCGDMNAGQNIISGSVKQTAPAENSLSNDVAMELWKGDANVLEAKKNVDNFTEPNNVEGRCSNDSSTSAENLLLPSSDADGLEAKENGGHLTKPNIVGELSSDDLSTSADNSLSDAIAVELPSADADLLKDKESGGHFAEPNNVEGLSLDDQSKSSLEKSAVDALDDPDMNVETETRPFYYFIRIPRYDDPELRKQINQAEVQLDEKTRKRDAVGIEYQEKKAICRELRAALEASRSEEQAARESFRAKLKEIDSTQSLIKLANDALSLKDFDSKIRNIEYKMQHEVLPLVVEKECMREIQQLKKLCEQLSTTSRKQERQQALDKKDQVEEKLRILRKEKDVLKESLSRAEEAVKVAKKRYDYEFIALNELSAEFRSADATRQDAYAHLKDLKNNLYKKNKYFWSYKDDRKAADSFAAAGDKDVLQQHCINQVEKLMELWNKNDHFRSEYIRCNTRSTLRRLETLDGRSLGPDEHPPSPASFIDDRVKALDNVNSDAAPSLLDQNLAIVSENTDNIPSKKIIDQKNLNLPPKKIQKAAQSEIEDEIEQHELEEEDEMARKEEELKREEEAASILKEQHRLEEKIKAQEALERKRRKEEKERARAELKAQKEAEEREKKREKRARKKEKKKGLAIAPETCTTNTETDASTRDPGPLQEPVSMAKKPQKLPSYAKQTKLEPIPSALRNRGQRRMRQWVWPIVTLVVFVVLFFLGDPEFRQKIMDLTFHNKPFY